MNNLDKVVRFEIIDHTPCSNCHGERWYRDENGKMKECEGCHGMGSPGRKLVFWDAHREVKASIQDDGRTLKIFIDKRE